MDANNTAVQEWKASARDCLHADERLAREAGQSYLINCTLAHRGGPPFLLATKESDPLMMVGFYGYTIAPSEQVMFVPQKMDWLDRAILRVARAVFGRRRAHIVSSGYAIPFKAGQKDSDTITPEEPQA